MHHPLFCFIPTVALIRFTQTLYSQHENMSPLSVNLVLESAILAQVIVVQITAFAQVGDTATGKEMMRK